MAGQLGTAPSRPGDQVSLTPGPGERPPVTPAEAEAALRRTLIDPTAPRPLRLASLIGLTEGDRWGLRNPQHFNGVPERGPDDGLVGDNPVLSPSQAQAYELCPRRYVLERRLRVGADTSIYATFGTLIHDVLEAAERAAIAADKERSDLDDALRELEARFDPDDFGGDPYADSWIRRAVSGLERLYETWPAPRRRTILLEHPLEAAIAGVRWIGRADRIDSSADGVTIVDYKTSRQAATAAEAAESLQLGFYVLASLDDESVAGSGTVTGAEFWYPMARTRRTTTRDFDMDRLEDVAARLATAATGITNENWTPAPGTHCNRCPLRTLCPAWPEGGPEFQ